MNLKKKFVIGAASLALVAGMGVAPAMAAPQPGDEIKFPDGGTFTRVFGDERIDTAIAVADRLNKDTEQSLKVAYLVSAGQNHMVDAATSGMLKDGLVFLVPQDKAGQLLLGATMKNKFSNVKKLVAIGGTSAVSDEAVANVKKMNANVTTTGRLEGKNRYETNVAVAKAAYKNNAGINRVYLTRGDNLVDALAAGSVADGPVLLVNHEGDLDPATVAYYQGLPKLNKGVVLGGQAALSDEQVNKLLKDIKLLDPWSYLKSTAERKAAVQAAAANYFGQDAWQRQQNSMPLKEKFEPKKLDSYDFFGQGATAAVAGTSKNPSDVNTNAVVTDTKKAFVGYKEPMTLLNKNMLVVTNKHVALQAALDVALRNAKAEKVKAAQLTSAPAGNNADAKLWQAVKDMYGLDPKAMQVVIKDGKISDSGAFEFDTDTQEITGLNDALFADVQAKLSDGGDWEKSKVYKVGAAQKSTLADTVYAVINADTDVVVGDAVTDKLIGVNWDALFNVMKDEQASMEKKTKEAKQALLDAVTAYYNGEGMKLLTGSGKGWSRLDGANRYETSALLAVYELQEGKYVNGSKVDPANGRVYLASGDDAHLIDSVVAGQLTDGPILLVPASGEIDKSVIQHLAYLKYKHTNLGTYMIGGKVAVSDEVRDEAVKALKHAKDYAGADSLGSVPAAPAKPYTTAPTLQAAATPAKDGTSVKIGEITNYAAVKALLEDKKGGPIAAADVKVTISAGSASDVSNKVSDVTVDLANGEIKAKIDSTATGSGKFKFQVTVKGYGDRSDTKATETEVTIAA
ncbi:cell wall-binding repeat-containing protein [Mobiluncus curtisii]|uniref:Gram-positive signal peptide protein, YSIRK family n=2 Tax=Mobiluncus curtisii TaxID=2051 RepID=D6ZL46_MOBCV|nr:cell wall-binding repeat-containing protein [Mobiluncus curtisii]ADI67445.1 Gram-positive signal peptide protein, YSIRK family [Mobiluncus curtisii ATCC 43063]NMW88677.1 cell wall-binding repeat-containing protein [Mobiluncus curtisii]QQU08826.1 cell wall-binding repeat-containing protein [Mobiluncus curtisii]SQB65366.1 Putative cell wall binding repeat 2 [Mobiluncus curtisii]